MSSQLENETQSSMGYEETHHDSPAGVELKDEELAWATGGAVTAYHFGNLLPHPVRRVKEKVSEGLGRVKRRFDYR